MSEEKRVDEDWKRQARAERETSAGEPRREPKESSYRGSIDFRTLVSMLATQAMMHLGAIPHPMTGQREQDLEQARVSIDTLELLEEKTRGNLTPQEKGHLEQILSDLRFAFVEATQPAPPKP